jgi:PPP family 3-phenylpropionic acid transporter
VPSAPLIVVALLLVFWVFESAWQPLADAITVNATGGRDYARIRLFTSAGFAVATIAAGFLYDAAGYAPAFALLAIAAGVMALAAAWLPDVARADLAAHRRRADPAAAPGSRGRRPGLGSTGVALRVAPRLGAVLVASFLLHIGIISGFTFLPLRIDDLGGAPSDVALSAGLSATMEIPAMLAIGVLARRIRLRVIFAAAALLYAACMASWMVIDVPLVIVATRALTGIGFAGVIIGVVLTIATILPKELQGTGQSLFQTSAFGLAAIAANVIGGVLYESFGHAALFGLGAALAVAAAIIGWLAFPRSPA